MNPNYCRLRLPLAETVPRLAAWLNIPEGVSLVPVDFGKAVALAQDERGGWRGHAIFVAEFDEWTLFQDISGILDLTPPEAWQVLAQSDELVYASYNSAVGCGAFVYIADGEIIRAFFDIPDQPDECYNQGRTEFPGEPFRSWVDVATFIDEDPLSDAEDGWLWLWTAR